MSDTPEVKLKKKLKALYKECGVLLVQPIGTVFTQAGVHDHILCVKGVFVSVEVKAGKKGPTGPQKTFGRMVRRAWGYAFCVNEYTFDMFATALRDSIERSRHDSVGAEFDRLQFDLEEALALREGHEGVFVFGIKEEDEE
jgi:hypothetical protein